MSEKKIKLTMDELIIMAREKPITDADIKAFEERCLQRRKKFQKLADSQKITKKFLDREYAI